MAQFSSGAVDKLREEWFDCPVHGPECYGCVYERTGWFEYDLTNPVNPILAYAREHPDEDILWSDLPVMPTDEQKIHAQRVLRKLHRVRTGPWIEPSPNGVDHLMWPSGRCGTCGGSHVHWLVP